MAKKFSQFPSAANISPGDSVVGLKDGANTRFSFATFLSSIQSLFVPTSRKVNNKALTSDITLDASDVGAVATSAVGAADGVASLDSTGKVPTSQLPSSTGPEPATATPLMDGTGAVGASTKYAREDHEHPADTNKQAKITANGILKGDGAGGVSAAVAGTDYQVPLTAETDYATPTQLDGKANQAQLAYVETGTTASRNYTAGQYISLSGLLYTADKAIAIGATFYTSGGNKNLTECVGGGFNNVNNKKSIISTSVIFEISGRTAVLRSKGNGATSTDIRNALIPQIYRPSSGVTVPFAYYNGSTWVNDGRCIGINSSTGAVVIVNLSGSIDTSLSFNFSTFCATWFF